ncbi:MAG: hypothetical protein A2X12_02035 [Bacteroidetes bacterium GWE2_29_8]|nr:MAG: hypothetical protein A2X12_02035 [Bacteroidetes bacterium GWE2_29_8]OFY24558.1 MAG: hypothetical protein A2X02_09815 [Bacteroidetes bacterium GWF2_29_10]
MKKLFLVLAVAGMMSFYACSGNKEEAQTEQTTEEVTATEEATPAEEAVPAEEAAAPAEGTVPAEEKK